LWIGHFLENTDPISVDSLFLNRHTLICGTTGSGKTVLSKVLIEETLSKIKIPVFAIDVQGDIMQLTKIGDQNITQDIPKNQIDAYFSNTAFGIFTPGSNSGIKISLDPCNHLSNLLKTQIPEEELQVIFSSISSTIVGILGTKGQAQDIYQYLIYRSLIESFSSKNPPKSLLELKEILDEDLAVDEQLIGHISKLKLQLELLISGPNSILFPEDGIALSIPDLISNIDGKTPLNIFYLNSLRTFEQKDFFIGYLATAMYATMLQEGKLKALLFLDEIKEFLPPGNKITTSKKPIIRLLEQGRKYELKLILSTQSPSKIHSSALSECNTRFYGLLSVQKDLDKIKEFISPNLIKDIPSLNSNQFIATSPIFNQIKFKTRWLYSIHGPPFTAEQIRAEKLISPSVEQKYKFNSNVILDRKITSENEISVIHDLPSSESEILEYLPVTPEDLDEVLNILQVIIIKKDTGISLFNKDTGKTKIDSDLMAGLLHAIRLMLKESFSLKEMKRLEVKEIGTYRDEHGFLIYLCEGQISVTALFLDRIAGSNLRRRLKSFVYAFEEEFSNEIKNFIGNVAPFRYTIDFLERYIGIGYLEPFEINHQNWLDHPNSFDPINRQIIQIINELMEELTREEGFYFSELINETIRRIRIPYFDLLGKLISLAENDVLYPMKGDIWKHIPSYSFQKPQIKDDQYQTEDFEILPIPPSISSMKENETKLLTETSLDVPKTPLDSKSSDFDNITDKIEYSTQKSQWFDQFINEIKSLGVINIRESILLSTLTREIEYDDKIGRLKLRFQEKLTEDDLTNYNYSWSNFKLKEKLKNTFGGPKYILQGPKEVQRVIISSILIKKDCYLVLVFG
jgi:hypothetical protein